VALNNNRPAVNDNPRAVDNALRNFAGHAD
jgi:hypothetical protein